MLQQMRLELENRIGELKDPVETIYFGGGSPSLLDPEELSAFFSVIKSNISWNNVQEITLETNPEDLTLENLLAWKNLGINRLSIGVQTLNETILHWMNRNHQAKDTIKGMNLLRDFDFSLSVDLIFGVPNQDTKDLLEMLKFVKDYSVGHVSAYALTNEPKTLLNDWIKKGKSPGINDDQQIEHYQIIRNYLLALGFEQYEISNYARKKGHSIHNNNYWLRKAYLGIGPGAHSFDGHSTRRWNIANNTKYLKQTHWFEIENLDMVDKWNECWLTGLRTIHGVSLQEITDLGGLRPNENKKLQELVKSKLLMNKGQTYRLTPEGFLQADKISGLFFRVH